MIFRGKGIGIKETETFQYHQDVHVLWQKSAWLDTTCALKWAQEVLSPFAEATYAGDPWLLFQDNLGAQRAKQSVEEGTKVGGQVVFGPPNATDGWQPIDRGGIGVVLKTLIGDQQECWLEQTDPLGEPNWKKWERGVSVAEKRILLTWWAGAS